MSEPVLFRDLAYVFVAAVAGGALARVCRQPLILGYVLGGLLVSPLTPGPSVSDLHTFELFAEIGVILLMFSIGLEFSLRDLLRVRRVALVGGPLGILLSGGLGWAVWAALGWPSLEGLVVGLVVSVASTMVLARLLLDRGELHTAHGRVMIGITLVEDLAVVILIVLMPSLGAMESGRLLAIGLGLAKAVLILAPAAYLAAKGIPRLLARVARTRSHELFLLVALAIGLGTAALTQALGLSPALGAFLAGLIISESDYAHETLARLLSLRDAFVALFFVTVGALIDPRGLVANLPLLAAIVALILVGKLVLWTGVVRLLGYSLVTALLVGVGLTQIGEFSFVLVQAARAAGHVGQDVYQAVLAASLLTILANAALVRLVPGWVGRARLARGVRPEAGEPRPPARTPARVVLGGFGRVGSAVGEALDTFGVPYVVVERDPDVVQALRARGVRCLYGDVAQPGLLDAAGVGQAALVVLALPETERTDLAVRHARALNPSVPILARTHERAAHDRLRAAGASEVVQPEVEAAAALIRLALGRLALPPERLAAYLDRFRGAMAAATPAEAGAAGLPEVKDAVLGRGALTDRSLREARIRERFGVTVVAVIRPDGDLTANPSPDTVLRAGDRVRLFGLPDQVAAFRAEAGRPEASDGAPPTGALP